MNAQYCAYCGALLHPNARFCSQCGRAVTPPQQAPAPPQMPAAQPAPVAAPPTEPILNILPSLQRSKGFLGMGRETFNLILTPARLVFVPVSSQEMKDAVAAANEQAKREGRGFLGRFAAQMAWVDVICQGYRAIPLDAVLAQHPGSFYILLGQVSRIRFRQASSDDETRTRDEIIIDSAAGKHRFELVTASRKQAKEMLRQVVPHAIR